MAEKENRHLCCAEICNVLIERDPEIFSYWYSLASALHSLGRYNESMDAFEKAEQYSNDRSLKWVLCRKGKLLQDIGRYGDAISKFEEAHECDQNEATPLIYLGSAHFRNNDVGKAEIAARKAVLCAKGAIDEAHYNLGCYLMSQNKLKEARLNFELAINLDPEYKIAKERLNDLKEMAKLSNPELKVVKC